jgi:hypothetical protein
MNDSDQPTRRLKLTLVVRDETDDTSILNSVLRAIEDGLRAPTERTVTSASHDPLEHHSPIDEQLETAAREAIEEALAKVIERFQPPGKEPAFDPAKWVEQLSEVWAVIHKAKAAGVQLHVAPPEPSRAEGP